MVRRWTSLALALVTGCFYVEEINSRPDGKIEGPNVVHEAESVSYSARNSTDPDDDGLAFEWLALTCPSGNSCRPIADAMGSGPTLTFVVPDNRDPITVQLRTRDAANAESMETLDVTVLNRAPEITALEVLNNPNGAGGFTAGRALSIGATYREDDPSDAGRVTFTWEEFPPPSSTPGATALLPPQTIDGTGFQTEEVGTWTVRLTISDGVLSDSDDLPVTITEDLDPCLGPLSPPAGDGTTPVVIERDLGPWTFRVASVIDDLDPYPYPNGTADPDLGRPTFRWFLAPPGEALAEVSGSDVAEYTLQPAAYAPGDELELRVEVRDRYPVAAPNWPACPSADATCAEDAPSCLQRATWKVRIR